MIQHLTKSEAQVMKLLWQSEKPLSCTEIVERSEDKTWKDSYVHSIIKSLIKKGIVSITSFELVSRSYARMFSPKISYTEYILLSSFSDEEVHNPETMSEFIRTILSYSDSEAIKKLI